MAGYEMPYGQPNLPPQPANVQPEPVLTPTQEEAAKKAALFYAQEGLKAADASYTQAAKAATEVYNRYATNVGIQFPNGEEEQALQAAQLREEQNPGNFENSANRVRRSQTDPNYQQAFEAFALERQSLIKQNLDSVAAAKVQLEAARGKLAALQPLENEKPSLPH